LLQKHSLETVIEEMKRWGRSSSFDDFLTSFEQ
jgi:hypothetical protein